MKFLTAILMCFLTTFAFAQNEIGVEATEMTTSKGVQPGFRMFIPDKTEKEVADSWINFTKDFKTKTKFDKINSEYLSDDATILKLSENTIDIYSTIINSQGGIIFSTAFDLGGIFISPSKTPDKYLISQDILRKFYGQMAKESVNNKIADATKALMLLEQDGNSLEIEIKKSQEDLTEIQNEIKTLELQAAAAKNEAAQQDIKISETQASYESLKTEIESLNVPQLELELKNVVVAGEKATLEKSKVEKDIQKKEAEIEALKIEIESLKLDIAGYNDEITKTTEAQNELEIKLKNTKIEEKEANLNQLAKIIEDAKKIKEEQTKAAENDELEIEKLKISVASTEKTIETTLENKESLTIDIQKQKDEIQSLEELKSSFE